MQRPRQRHFTPLGRNLLTASASRARTQPCQSPSRGAKSGQHNDMLIRWTCRNTHLTLDPSDNNHNNVTQYLFHFFAHLAIVLHLFNIFRTSWWCLLTIHHYLFLYYMCDYSIDQVNNYETIQEKEVGAWYFWGQAGRQWWGDEDKKEDIGPLPTITMSIQNLF